MHVLTVVEDAGKCDVTLVIVAKGQGSKVKLFICVWKKICLLNESLKIVSVKSMKLKSEQTKSSLVLVNKYHSPPPRPPRAPPLTTHLDLGSDPH